MKIAIMCEESGIIRDSFRKQGHDAYSIDLKETSIPSNYHIKNNCLNRLNDGWDMMIGHPPCTYIALCQIWRESRKKICLEREKNMMKLFNSFGHYGVVIYLKYV